MVQSKMSSRNPSQLARTPEKPKEPVKEEVESPMTKKAVSYQRENLILERLE